MFFSSRGIELELEAETTRVKSSAYFRKELRVEVQRRSAVLMTKSAGPRVEPCTTLALIGRGEESCELERVMWDRAVKKSNSHSY